MAWSHWGAPWEEQAEESNQQGWSRWRSRALQENEDDDDVSRQQAVAAPPLNATAILQQWPSPTEVADFANLPGLQQQEYAGNVLALDPPSSTAPPSLCPSSSGSFLAPGPVLLDKIDQLSASLKVATASLVDEETVIAARRLHAELAHWLPTVVAATSITTACHCSATAHENRCRADVLVTFDPAQMTTIGRLTPLREFDCWSYCRCSAYLDTTGAQCDSFVIVRHGGCCIPLTGWHKAGGKAKKFICCKLRH